MAQQINLCTPILLTQKRYFSAQTMVQALAILLVVGGGLLSYWVWSLNAASEGFKKTLSIQSHELEGLESALKQGKAGVGSSDSALTQELQNRRAEVLLREKVLDELQRGLLRPDGGHSARLRLVAQSIPVPAWITEVRADETQLEVRGYTLDPSVLSDWVNKLAASPLMQGQKLSAVKVERASAAVAKTSSGAAVLPSPAASLAVASTSRSVWSFNLLSRVTQSSAQAGSKP